MLVEKIFDDEYKEFINSNNSLLVFGMNSCIDCVAYQVIIEDIARKSKEKNLDIRFGKVTLDDRIKSMLNIKRTHSDILKERITPYTLFFQKGNLVYKLPDLITHTIVERDIKKYLGIEI